MQNAALIDEQVMELFDIMFWRGIANPQSGQMDDCCGQIGESWLWRQVHSIIYLELHPF